MNNKKMNENLFMNHQNLCKNIDVPYRYTKIQKKPFPSNFLLSKQNFHPKNSQSPFNIKITRNTNYSINKRKIIPPNLSNSQYIFNNNSLSKYNQLRQMVGSRSQKIIEDTISVENKPKIMNESKINDKNAQKFLLLKIDEVNKTLVESENIFRYNQKIMKKKLEEKNNEIITLKNELEKEKVQKQTLYNDIYNENKNNFLDDIKQLQKQIEKLSIMNNELSEQNIKYEKKIENLENKNKTNILKIQEMTNKYNSLMKEKTNNLLEEEIKQYITDLNIQIELSQKELNALNEEMSYLNEENKRLKFLTREIIEARNETEIFFLDVLDDAKMDLYKQKKEKNNRNCFFPRLKNFYENGKDNIKIDIKEFTPEIREKILRNLFEKINRGYNEQNYRQLNYIMDEDISYTKE